MLAWVALMYPQGLQATGSYDALLSNIRCARRAKPGALGSRVHAVAGPSLLRIARRAQAGACSMVHPACMRPCACATGPARWGADFLLASAAQAPASLVAAVGDADADHQFWDVAPLQVDVLTRTSRRAINVRPRPAAPAVWHRRYSIGRLWRCCHPVSTALARPAPVSAAAAARQVTQGADLGGQYAAALAAASMLFASDAAYSAQLLDAAKRAYAFAEASGGSKCALHEAPSLA